MKSVTKAEFDRQRQWLWVYLRHEGRCADCGKGVGRDEAATGATIPVALGIDALLQVRLTHSLCDAAKAGRMSRPAAV
jgi:hypothetical protein